ncbi:MAG: DUF1015 domain-containing protein, partial [Bacteroidetes bacterium]|nr:DUF1015 domain-containing protein [Bacteroidota bacterium]
MATIRPFKGFRPLPRHATEVASKPYDVLSSEEAREEAAGKPLSFLHVGKPEIDLPADMDLYDERVYQKGHENLQKLIAAGVLEQDHTPCFYVYSQTMGNHTQYGIVGCASVAEYVDDTIKKHELTRKDKEDDRTKHVMVTKAHSGPIFLTYRSVPAIDRLVQRVCEATPVYDFEAEDGIGHRLWVIDDNETNQTLEAEFKKVSNLYVADGHHRSAAAARVGKELASNNPNHTGEEEYNFFLAVLFPHSQLHILDYNRVVRELNGLSREEFLNNVGKAFEVQPSPSPVRPSRKGEIGMYLDRQWYRLRARPEKTKPSDPVARLEVSLLQREILAPILEIEDPRTSKQIDFVGGIRGLEELEKRVDSGEMAVAFALFPTTIDELLAIADAGKIMPPKSTW